MPLARKFWPFWRNARFQWQSCGCWLRPAPPGQTLSFGETVLPVQAVSEETLKGLDLILASAGASVSRQWLPIAVQEGAIAIDNSSAYRMDPNVPLVVPEVSPEDLKTRKASLPIPTAQRF